MSIVNNLGYLVIGAKNPAEWETFGRDILGAMAETGPQGEVCVRLDEFKYRLLIVADEADRLIASGWTTSDFGQYSRALAHVRELGVEIIQGTAEECALRAVEDFFTVEDPSGNSHEICWGRTIDARPFVSTAGIKNFVTGSMGFGHTVLPCPVDFEKCVEFYEQVFGFDYSDFFRVPAKFDGNAKPGARVFFFHPDNVRQHSLAIGELESAAGIAHFEVEVPSLDDLGRALDRANRAGMLARTMGRHVNDSVVSFYIRTPGGFLVEYGYDGKQMDWENHEVTNIPQGSYWGHEWL